MNTGRRPRTRCRCVLAGRARHAAGHHTCTIAGQPNTLHTGTKARHGAGYPTRNPTGRPNVLDIAVRVRTNLAIVGTASPNTAIRPSAMDRAELGRATVGRATISTGAITSITTATAVRS